MANIEYKNINLSFEEKKILEDFSLQIKESEKILISGKSGKGKSTLIRMLLGFQTPDSGQILVGEKSITSDHIFEFRQNFAYVNQDITLRNGIVKNVLTEISSFKGNQFEGTLSEELLEHFEVESALLEKKTSQLSGGERQRLGIILAIMLDRPIYLLDEITSSLDKELKEKVVSYFENIDKTVLAVSHDEEWEKNRIFRKVVW